ncbi:MAG: PIN domain-containing protein [Promethearchaeota archaeon]
MNSENINYLFDTYAWIEYFLGSKEGKVVKQLLEKENILTSIISIAELSDKYYREDLFNEWEGRYNFIVNKSTILPISLDIAKRVGQSKWELRNKGESVGLADSLILETAKEKNLIIVTGDPHFKDVENVRFLS